MPPETLRENHLPRLLDKLRADEQRNTERLAVELERLARYCTEEAAGVRRRMVVNSLGIIQRRGLDVDVQAAALEQLRDTLRELGALTDYVKESS